MSFIRFTDLVERGETIVATGIAEHHIWNKWRKESERYRLDGHIDSRVLVTYTGSYMNGYRQGRQGWEQAWVMANSEFGDMYSKTAAEFWERGKQFLADILAGRDADC